MIENGVSRCCSVLKGLNFTPSLGLNFSDAAHIVEEIALLKTRTSGAAGTTAAADPIE